MELTRNFPSDSEASIENPYTLTKSGTAALNISFKKTATLNMLCPVQMNRFFFSRIRRRAAYHCIKREGERPK